MAGARNPGVPQQGSHNDPTADRATARIITAAPESALHGATVGACIADWTADGHLVSLLLARYEAGKPQSGSAELIVGNLLQSPDGTAAIPISRCSLRCPA